jgi:hypothetical protein
MNLDFQIESAAPVPFAATPLIALNLRVSATQPVQAVALRCQVRIEPQKRRYTDREALELDELFGLPERFAETLRPFLWTHASALLPAFADQGRVALHLPCPYDFGLAATKYFHAVSEGEVPLLLLFSGTIFHTLQGGGLTVTPVPWSKEAQFRMPVCVLKESLEQHYPNSAGLRLRRDVFDRLRHFKTDHGFATWEQAIERLLEKESAASEASQ